MVPCLLVAFRSEISCITSLSLPMTRTRILRTVNTTELCPEMSCLWHIICVSLSFQVGVSTIRGGSVLSDDQVLSNYFTLHTISLGDIKDL